MLVGLKRGAPWVVAVLVGGFLFAARASANTYVASCEVNGTALTNEVPLVGLSKEPGSYVFSSHAGATGLDFLCSLTDETTNDVAVTRVDVTSSGSFNNVICGTGTADSSIGDTKYQDGTAVSVSGSLKAANDFGAALDESAYRIAFSGGQGRFWWGPAGVISSVDSSTLPADGTITIVPAFDEVDDPAPGAALLRDVQGNPVQPGGDCSAHFSVTGLITGRFSVP